jgi:hypothetical protein
VGRSRPRTGPHSRVEIAGIDVDVLATFSKRSQGIAEIAEAEIAEFAQRRGRPPAGPEVTRIRQKATLATRPAKTVAPLHELQGRWRAEAVARTGESPDRLVAGVLTHATAVLTRLDDPAVPSEAGLAPGHVEE